MNKISRTATEWMYLVSNFLAGKPAVIHMRKDAVEERSPSEQRQVMSSTRFLGQWIKTLLTRLVCRASSSYIFLAYNHVFRAISRISACKPVHTEVVCCLELHRSAYRFWWGPRELTVLWARTKQQDVPNALGTEGSTGARKTKYT